MCPRHAKGVRRSVPSRPLPRAVLPAPCSLIRSRYYDYVICYQPLPRAIIFSCSGIIGQQTNQSPEKYQYLIYMHTKIETNSQYFQAASDVSTDAAQRATSPRPPHTRCTGPPTAHPSHSRGITRTKAVHRPPQPGARLPAAPSEEPHEGAKTHAHSPMPPLHSGDAPWRGV
eukprot:scaffold689_cov375-Prasinococcus_capsulatus_cf.AAC.1